MIFKKTWERYYLHKFLFTTILFLTLMYFLYVVIDFSFNLRTFLSRDSAFLDIAFFYALQFSKRLFILLPLALLLALIRILCQSAQRNELTALLTGGISRFQLLRPFFFVALCAVILELLNVQYFLPYALEQIDNYAPHADSQEAPLKTLTLDDGTLLIFQSYSSNKNSCFDVFVVFSSNKIYRIKHLDLLPQGVKGHYVDELIKASDGRFVKVASHVEKVFPELHIAPEKLCTTTKQAEDSSLTELWNRIRSPSGGEDPAFWTWLLSKTLFPFICLLVIFAPAPFCMRFQRHLKVFSIYCIALFLFIALYTILDAAIVIGSNGVYPPFVVIVGPLLVYFVGFGIPFVRTL